MPYFAYPEWTLSLSQVPATNVTVNLSFASSLTVGNYLDTGASETITVPAGQMTVKQRFPITMYTGTTSGTVTATVDAGTGYTVAAAPDNAAAVQVNARAKLLITTVPADTQRTVTEGDRYDFSLTWQTATGLPKPRERIVLVVEPNSTRETASHDGDNYAAEDYKQAIEGARVGAALNRVALEPADWTLGAPNVYEITKQFAVVTTEDSELELSEPIELLLGISGADAFITTDATGGLHKMGYTGGACGDSRYAQFRGEGLCAPSTSSSRTTTGLPASAQSFSAQIQSESPYPIE